MRPNSLPRRRNAAPRFPRLRLEHLEDRAVPAIITVTSLADNLTPGEGRTLREAVQAANNLPGADVIVLRPGLYKINSDLGPAGEDDNQSGDFDIKDAVTILGAGAGQTIIDGRHFDRVFDIEGPAIGFERIRVVLQGLTIRNGEVSDHGGGILVGNADLVVRDSEVVANHAHGNGSGGGISNAELAGTGNVRVVRSTVARNTAAVEGGGLYVLGSAAEATGSELTLRSSTVQRNTALAQALLAEPGGGGIRADVVTLFDSTVAGNVSAGYGGGILTGTVSLTRSTVSGNAASFAVGGIYATIGSPERPTPGTATLTRGTVNGNSAGLFAGGLAANVLSMTNCTVARNTSGEGGGGLYAFTSGTLTNSTITGNATNSFGGGIVSLQGNLTLTSCTVSENTSANDGGGIYSPSGNATLTDTTVSGNTSAHDGGGILASSATLTRSSVSGNFAGGDGGGIRALGLVQLTDSTINGNRAASLSTTDTADGGGIFAGEVTATGSTISDNIASHFGGGINAEVVTLTRSAVSRNTAGRSGGGVFSADVTLTRSIVSDNRAVFFLEADGGGIHTGLATITASTISGNVAERDGGGIRAQTAILNRSTTSGNIANRRGGGLFADSANTPSKLTNSTISGNSAVLEGGGVWAMTADVLNCTVAENLSLTHGGGLHSGGGVFNVKNSIVAQNLAGITGQDVASDGAAFTSLGHNLIGNITGGAGFTNCLLGDIVGDEVDIVDPRLAPLANNGGPTRTHALRPGSLAIDAGDNTGLIDPITLDPILTDQRGVGFPRVKDGNGDGAAVVDIGAFER